MNDRTPTLFDSILTAPAPSYPKLPRARRSPKPKAPEPADNSAPAPAPGIAQKLRALAAGMQREIDHKLAPMSQAYTPRRGRMHAARVHDGHDAQRAQAALRALADAHDAGTVPAILAGVRSKAVALRMTRTHADCSGGYYSHRETDEPCDTSEAAIALRDLVTAAGASGVSGRAESEQRERLDRLRQCNRPGFFPTPGVVAQIVIDAADIEPGHTVLEPSAGIGSLAELCPDRDRVACVEIVHDAAAHLFAAGFDTDCAHFLTDWAPERIVRRFDRVVMNPPFENQAEIDHVRHAFRFLAPGGRLVAVMPNGTRHRSGRKAAEFREWVAELGGEWRDLPAGAFDTPDAFRRTGVACSLLILDAGA